MSRPTDLTAEEIEMINQGLADVARISAEAERDTEVEHGVKLTDHIRPETLLRERCGQQIEAMHDMLCAELDAGQVQSWTVMKVVMIGIDSHRLMTTVPGMADKVKQPISAGSGGLH